VSIHSFLTRPTQRLTSHKMGIGIGGDYPLSAVIASEFSATRIRGRLMTCVFASQGWGNFSAYHPYSNRR
jgi:MFS family permease